MSCRHEILIAAKPLLLACLAEQFAFHPEFVLIETEEAGTALELLAEAPDLAILDEELSGLSLEMARGRFSGPLVSIAARESGPAEPAPGACGRVARPFRFADLLARVRKTLRRIETQRQIPVGAFLLRPGAKELVRPCGARLRLTEKEAAVLTLLARSGGAPVSREILLRDVWGYSSGVATRTLETHIHRLRRKIEPKASHARLLVADAGGYRLAAGQGSPSSVRAPDDEQQRLGR